jgi:hypothetical protein
MKKQVLTLVTLLGLLLVNGAAYAQSSRRIIADVPFDFVVGNKIISAGHCEVEPIGSSEKAVLVRNANFQSQAIVVFQGTQSLKPATETVLIFHRYGDQYFLSGTKIAGSNVGRKIYVSPREVKLAKNYKAESVVRLAELR